MKVKELKELIADLDDDMDIVRPGPDHSFPSARLYKHTVLDEGGGNYTDDVRHFNPRHPGKPIQVLVVE